MLKKFLLGNSESALRDSYIWNMIASGINASEAIVVLMVATRTVGVEASGVLTIAFSLANLLLTIGNFGMRNFQVTDFSGKYIFDDYFFSRCLTVGLMDVLATIYVVFMACSGDYSFEKSYIVWCVIVIFSIESMEGVFVAKLQHDNRLDIAMRMFSVRWLTTIICWSVCLFLFKNSVCAVSATIIVDLFSFFILIYLVKEKINEEEKKKYEFRRASIGTILLNCLPLCIAGFSSYYTSNSPKYAIDRNLSDEIQACYGFVSMPIFVIGLINAIIYQPVLVNMAKYWDDRDNERFAKMILRQISFILGISVICVLGASWVGIPVLSWLYATNLESYKDILIILMFAGMGLAFSGFFNSVLTIMRKQKLIMYIYTLTAVIAFAFSNRIVLSFGVIGVAYMNLGLMFIQTLIFAVATFGFIRREKT